MEKFENFRIDEYIVVQGMNEVQQGQIIFLNSSAREWEWILCCVVLLFFQNVFHEIETRYNFPPTEKFISNIVELEKTFIYRPLN